MASAEPWRTSRVSRRAIGRGLLAAAAGSTLLPALPATAGATDPTTGGTAAGTDPIGVGPTTVDQSEVVPAASLVPAAGALFGAFVKHDPDRDPGISEPEALESVTHELLGIDHSFQHWDQTFRTDRLTDDIARGRTPLLSWGAGPQSVLAATAQGVNDELVRQQAGWLRALRQPVLLRFTWEMDLPQRGYTPATFKEAWRRVRTIFREERADNVAFVFCPTWLAFRTGRVSSFWPGDSMVDWVGADGYARPSNDHAPLTELFPWFYDFGIRHDKPMILAEVGVNDTAPGVQADWLRQARTDLRTTFPLVRAMVYFDSRGSGETDWVLPGNPRTEAALRQLVHDPYFLPRPGARR
ncbi:glycosyl hydrolase [Micromonospora sp. NBC_00389]|uniref:glycoside hydrolase family 26 protein n=1 Tax=Micromonospora sp. NBC_00389 TaxID=2903586 RepID=UPI002E1F58C4